MKLGILVGVTLEAKLLQRTLPPGFPAAILLSGARRDVAERQIRRFQNNGVTHLLSFGFAGGLDPALASGTILLPSAVVELDGLEHRTDPSWHKAASDILHSSNPIDCKYLGVDQPIVDRRQKQDLFERSRACALDMESHLVARAGVPFLVLRAVCDVATDRIPPAALTSTREDGSTAILLLLASIIRHPTQITDLIRLGGAAKKARNNLLRCCDRGAASGFGVG